MAERYNKLYSLPKNLYAAGSPVLVSAGALLKDNQSGNVLCQLKFRSIADGSISALKVLVIGYDMSREEVCRVEHQYLDLNVKRNGVFGAKEAIPLPERSVRSYEVKVLAAFFADGSRYFADDQLWEPLPESQPLRTRLFDRELIRQYKLDTTEKSEYVPMGYKDLWLCACGEINAGEEECCYSCSQALEDLNSFLNVDILLEQKNARLMQEAKHAAERESSRAHSAKIIKRVLLVIVPLLIIAGLAWFFYSRSMQREADYEMAGILFEAEKYTEAAKAYDELGNYKDAEAMANRARDILAEQNAYEKAGKFLENGRYDDAYTAYTGMGDYLDAAELAKEALYLKAVSLAEGGDCAAAKALFEEISGYKDAERMAEAFIDVLSESQQSYNPECVGPLTVSYVYDEAGLLKTKTEHFSAYPGLNDRVINYSWNGDGSYTETEGRTLREYDTWGVLLSTDGVKKYNYDYGYYDNGELYYVCAYDAETDGFVSELVYDEQGNLIRCTNTDGSVSNTTNEYDGEGRLTKTENFDSEGSFINRTSYEYDGEGRLKRSTYMDLENTTIVTNYSYVTIYAPEAE